MEGGGVGLEMQGTQIEVNGIPKVDIYVEMSYKWFVIKHSAAVEKKKRKKIVHYLHDDIIVEPALPPLPGQIKGATFAAAGTIIYASGGADLERQSPGHYYSSNKVFSIDTLHLKEGWKAAPPMIAERSEHCMLVDAGKMYAVGGLSLFYPPDPVDGKITFSEVYDLSNPDSGWKPLARVTDDDLEDLPVQISGHAVVKEEYGDSKTILFHSTFNEDMFYFNTSCQDDEIGIFDENFGGCHPSSAFLDGVLYFLHNCNFIYAYDLVSLSSKKERVRLRDVKANTLPRTRSSSRLLSLGNGYLALIWANIPEGIECFTEVHCSIIYVSKVGGYFQGNVVRYSSHSVKGGRTLKSCMAVASSCIPEEEDVSLDVADHVKISDKLQPCKRKRMMKIGSSNDLIAVSVS